MSKDSTNDFIQVKNDLIILQKGFLIDTGRVGLRLPWNSTKIKEAFQQEHTLVKINYHSFKLIYNNIGHTSSTQEPFKKYTDRYLYVAKNKDILTIDDNESTHNTRLYNEPSHDEIDIIPDPQSNELKIRFGEFLLRVQLNEGKDTIYNHYDRKKTPPQVLEYIAKHLELVAGDLSSKKPVQIATTLHQLKGHTSNEDLLFTINDTVNDEYYIRFELAQKVKEEYAHLYATEFASKNASKEYNLNAINNVISFKVQARSFDELYKDVKSLEETIANRDIIFLKK